MSAIAQDDLDFLFEQESTAESKADTSRKSDASEQQTPSDAETQAGVTDTNSKSNSRTEPIERANTSARARPSRTRLTEEIIVTAQRRAQNIRDVPIAISVVSGDALRDAGISSFDDFARLIPNVSFNTDFNSLYLRGIGTAELNVIGEQAVSYILDDVYVPRLDFLKAGMLDVARIEVLKGPQGTLYGRNATGGVLKVGYGEPTDEWDGYVDVAVGERDRQSVEAAVSGPLTERLTFRVALRSHEEDGYVWDQALNRFIGGRDQFQARVKLRADISENFRVELGYEHFDYFIGQWAGSEISIYPDGLRATFGQTDPNFESEVNRQGSSSRVNRSEGQGFIAPLTLTLDKWGHTFTSVSSLAGLDDIQGGDAEGLAIEAAQIFADQDYSQFSQEIRVVSPPGRVTYVGGLYYLKTDLNAVTSLPITGDLVQILATSGLGPPLAELGLEDVLQDIVPPTSGNDEVEGQSFASLLEATDLIEVESLGVFGQVDIGITDKIHLLLGARYSRDEKDGFVSLQDRGPLPLWTPFILGGYTVDRNFVDRDFSPKISLTWEPLDAATLYATYAEGSRGGSFNIAAFTQEDVLFDAERSKTYEVGVKTELFNGIARFNLGGYHTIYEDYQLAALNGFTYIIENAPEALSRGIEADLTTFVSEGLLVNATFGFNDAEFVDHPNGGCITQFPTEPGYMPSGIGALPPQPTCDLSGQQLFRAPRYSGSVQINYQAPLFDWPWEVFVGADANYKGDEFQDSDLDPDDFQEGYWLYNGRLGIRRQDGRWSLELQGKNLSDELVNTFSGDIPFQPGAHWVMTNPPRTFFARLRYSFGQ